MRISLLAGATLLMLAACSKEPKETTVKIGQQGTAAAQKLVDAKVSGVIGHLNSGTTIPASKIYSDAGIPQITPSSTNPTLTRQGFKTTFRVVADDVHLGGTLGRYAVDELKGKAIALIAARTASGSSGVNSPTTKRPISCPF